MKLGRILRESLEGAVPRLVVVQPEEEYHEQVVIYQRSARSR